MNILVCIKQTFDTEEKINLREGKVLEEDAQWIVNPYDEYAIEEALSIKENNGGEVTVISIGPERTETALRHALAMGADKAVLIEEVDGDESTLSKVFAAYASDKNFDLILTGNQSIDSGSGQVGVRLAEELGIPHITSIVQLEIDGDKLLIERDVEGEIYKIEASLPLLVSCQQGLNEPRYPSLPNIMKAKRKPLETIEASDLIDSQEVLSARTEVVDRYLPAKRKVCTRITEEPAAAGRQLVTLLFKEAKIF
ncbi:electron transfer flavoprotein subunit beta/FixA family protein [Aneurinibacillus tyrosinisolvens]|uniref:electron transfer flavoprotein subunit beta/FixA family protein n=1 Tax=Aneurinibacillus tyrosinisolvens TaxID=1443435 RepID=UPI00063F9E63|nr:electron transfer flavoprotein subunit beta/FixA family protein [Aneurinibacillus tyrosinisolvens]